MPEQVMVAMSGGVDSAVAASLLKEQGYQVCGVTMKLFDNSQIGLEYDSTCCSLADVEDARQVSHRMNFDHYVLGCSDRFHREVIGRFADSYARGETPNPCIDCNRYVKFPYLMERADMLGMDRIATGHYARIQQDLQTGRYLLKRAKDGSKDQSYVLYAMTQKELSRTLFPLGDMAKAQVREYAAAHQLNVASKPDSQDICFIKDRRYGEFLTDIMGVEPLPGDVLDGAGTVLGKHRGILHYTIGQRKGLPVQMGKPAYVVHKDPVAATITLGEESDLYAQGLTVSGVNWIAFEQLKGPLEVTVQTRYRQREAPAILEPTGDPDRANVYFQTPQRAVTPGQAAVFYSGDLVVGGGTIEAAIYGREHCR